MIRRPPRSTRTDTLFPYTTLFRSSSKASAIALMSALSKKLFGGRWISTVATMPSWVTRSEEHTSELQSLMRISYAVFCLKKKNKTTLIKKAKIASYHQHDLHQYNHTRSQAPQPIEHMSSSTD